MNGLGSFRWRIKGRGEFWGKEMNLHYEYEKYVVLGDALRTKLSYANITRMK